MKKIACIALLHFTSTIAVAQITGPPSGVILNSVFEPFCDESEFTQEWTYTGPAHDIAWFSMPGLGLVSAVDIHPTDSDIMFAGSNTSGLYKTIDGGTNWYSVTDDLNCPGLGVTSIAIDQTDPDVMYMATGATSNFYGGYSLGVMKSTNGGESWVELDLPGIDYDNTFKEYVMKVVKVSPHNSDLVIAGGYRNLWVSDDAGATWTAVFPTSGFYLADIDDEIWNFTDIEFDPLDEDVIYASTEDNRFDNSLGVTSFKQALILKSTDAGDTWNWLWEYGSTPLLPDCDEYILLDFSPIDPTILYAAYLENPTSAENDDNLHIAKTTDGGVTWTDVYTSTNDNDTSFGKAEFEVSPNRESAFYIGSTYFYIIYLENGVWKNELENTNYHDDARDMKVYSFSSGIDLLLSGNDGGISSLEIDPTSFTSGNDNDLLWLNKNGSGLRLSQIYGLGIWNGTDRGIYGAQDNSYWSFAGNQYLNSGAYADGGFSSACEHFAGLGVSGTQHGKSYTDDFGGDWASVPSIYDSQEAGATALRTRQCFSEKDQRIMMMGEKTIATWTYNPSTGVYGNTPTTYSFPQGAGLTKAIAIAPSNGTTIYVAKDGTYWSALDPSDNPDNRLFKSTDGGITYSDITENLFMNINGSTAHPYSWHYINCMTIDPRDPQKVYAGIALYASEAEYLRVIVSSDGGSTWEDMSSGLPPYGVNQLLYQDGTDEIIYAATNAGVYRWNKDEESWECFNNELPPCIVTSLDIEPCSNTLQIATYGKGLWQIELPRPETDVVFDSDYTVDTYEVRAYEKDIIVNDEATLTVKGRLNMKPDNKIVVKPGGKLIIDGGLLTNACPGQLWQGIVLEGNPAVAQLPFSNQGYCELKNGAVIENAHTGVHVAGLIDNGNGIYVTDETKTGGVLKATDATFLNCYVGVEFFPYTSFMSNGNPRSNKSLFTRCQFITDRVLFDSPIVTQPEPKAGIIMNETYRIKIRGCQFRNEAIGNPEYADYYDSQYKRGDGIQANSAVFLCYNSATTDGLNTPIPCEFENLEHGIKALCGDYIKPFSCKYAKFIGNFCGIRSEGSMLGPVIQHNDFTILPMEDNSDGEEITGIEMDHTTRFTISENTFEGFNIPSTQVTVGMAFNNTGLTCNWQNVKPQMAHNLVYLNNMDDLDYGINVQGINSQSYPLNASNNYGLEFRCNKFGQLDLACHTDFNLYQYSTVQLVQGALVPNNEAANIFDNDYCDVATEHFKVGQGATVIDKYYHNPNDGSTILEPSCYNSGSLVPLNTDNQYDEQATCPSTIIGGINVSQVSSNLSTSMAQYNETHDIYNDLIDQGDHEALADMIEDHTTPSIDIRNELIQCAPYVSDEIWRQVIYRTVPLNPWHVAQALLANSPLSQGTLSMLQSSDFDPYYVTLVENGQNGGLTSKQIFESDLVLLNRQVHEAQRMLIDHYLLDEEDDEVDRLGEMKELLDVDVPQDRLTLAAISVWQKDYAMMDSLLADCHSNGLPGNHCTILYAIAADRQDGNTALTATTINLLRTLDDYEDECGYAQARAWLHEYTEYEYPQNIETESSSYRSLHHSNASTTIALPILSAQPNPSKDIVYITYQLPNGVETCEMEIIDSNGQLIEKRLATGKGLEEWNCKQCPSGIYLVRLIADGIELGVIKVSLLK